MYMPGVLCGNMIAYTLACDPSAIYKLFPLSQGRTNKLGALLRTAGALSWAADLMQDSLKVCYTGWGMIEVRTSGIFPAPSFGIGK